MTNSTVKSIIIGSYSDPHVQDVAGRLDDPIVLDVEILQKGDTAVATSGLIGLTNQEGQIFRGWIRRLAPVGWTHGTLANSRQAMEQAAWLSMLVSFIRTSNVGWLTNIDRLISAENKLLLSKISNELGVSCPRSIIACSPHYAAELLGTTDLVAKPIVPSNFILGNDYVSIPTNSVSSLTDSHFIPEPYLYQKRIYAKRHLRVVTVGKRYWCYSGNVAEDDPIDWRYSTTGHDGFILTVDQEIGFQSLALADALGIGYSSQDWIDDGDSKWVVDINPAGQWLFLEKNCGVGNAIASWLQGDSCG